MCRSPCYWLCSSFGAFNLLVYFCIAQTGDGSEAFFALNMYPFVHLSATGSLTL